MSPSDDDNDDAYTPAVSVSLPLGGGRAVGGGERKRSEIL